MKNRQDAKEFKKTVMWMSAGMAIVIIITYYGLGFSESRDMRLFDIPPSIIQRANEGLAQREKWAGDLNYFIGMNKIHKYQVMHNYEHARSLCWTLMILNLIILVCCAYFVPNKATMAPAESKGVSAD